MSEDLMKELDKYKNNFYRENKKSVFTKKSQKYELAKEITSKFDVNILLQKTAYIIPNTNKLFVNYKMFKQFAQPDNYELFVKYVQNLVHVIIKKRSNFECHIDIDSFTISAAERYKGVVQIFCKEVFGFTEYMGGVYVYNSPTMIDKISKVFMHFLDQELRDKIIIVKKEGSEKTIAEFKQYSFRRQL